MPHNGVLGYWWYNTIYKIMATLQSDTQEITVRLLQNGRYVWTITVNTPKDVKEAIPLLKQLDGELRDSFPNHVKESSVQFKEFKDE